MAENPWSDVYVNATSSVVSLQLEPYIDSTWWFVVTILYLAAYAIRRVNTYTRFLERNALTIRNDIGNVFVDFLFGNIVLENHNNYFRSD